MRPPISSPAVLHKGLYLPDVAHSFQPWVPLLGHLQRTVMEGEYLPLGPLLPMFESDFFQVTNQGETLFLHKKENPVTMGVASSIPGLLLPDLILLARPVGCKRHQRLVLTRLLPMPLARLFVHNVAAWRLKLHLASGRTYYLRLDADQRDGGFLFNRWRQLVYLLGGPGPSWAPMEHRARPPRMPSPANKLKEFHKDKATQMVPPVESSIKVRVVSPSPKDLSTQKSKEMVSRAVSDSIPFITQMEPPTQKEDKKWARTQRRHKKPLKKVSSEPVARHSTITIWTVFSIISSTLNSSKPSRTSSPMISNLDSQRTESCMAPKYASSSWFGSHTTSKKSFHSTDSSGQDSPYRALSHIDVSVVQDQVHVHPRGRAWSISSSLLSSAWSWGSFINRIQAHLPPQEPQHEVPQKTHLPTKPQKKRTVKSHLRESVALTKAEKVAILSRRPFKGQRDKSSLGTKQSRHKKGAQHRRSLRRPPKSPRTPYQSTQDLPFRPSEASRDLSAKASEPRPSAKATPEQPTKASPKHLKKSPHRPSAKATLYPTSQASPDQFTKASEPSPSAKATPKELPRASPKHLKKSLHRPSAKATLYPTSQASPDRFTKASEPSPSAKTSSKGSKKHSFFLFIKTLPKYYKKSPLNPFTKVSPPQTSRSSKLDTSTKASPSQSTED